MASRQGDQRLTVDQGDDAAETAVSRRQWLRASAGVATGVVALGAVSKPTRAAHADETPSHVSKPVFDEQLLERFKPRLLTQDLNVEPSSIHGFVVTSSRRDTVALTYWTEYPVQLDTTGFASHIGDHEPFYVIVRNLGTADEYIERVVYSGYHWLAAVRSDPPTDTGDDVGRPRAYVFPQYHHYSIEQARGDPRQGVDLPLKDLTSSLPRWLDDEDFHSALAEDWNDLGSPAYNPWIMLDKASWWRESGLSELEVWIRSAWLWLGIRGADGSDLN